MTNEEAITIIEQCKDINFMYTLCTLTLYDEVLDMAIKALKDRPTGKWKRVSMDKYVQHAMAFYRCSECGEDIIGEHNYCPNCGAKMQKEGD